MGKQLRSSLRPLRSLSSLEHRIATRSYLQKQKSEDVKPINVSFRKRESRLPLHCKGNTSNSPLTAPPDEVGSSDSSQGDSKDVCLLPSASRNLELPGYRQISRPVPLRITPRHINELTSCDVYLKRHEKLDKLEKMIQKRDRKWQRAEEYRLHLLKISQSEKSPDPQFTGIKIVPKMPKFWKV
ncbi:hypothetical protein AB6A40_005610 [Gnathostoma spinigerum]|uniref:Uncharacterized protein n=1 Tax=Gnathostoma spinigerum TaxID=75299 RepID=A0ABD6EI36_9BILA